MITPMLTIAEAAKRIGVSGDKHPTSFAASPCTAHRRTPHENPQNQTPKVWKFAPKQPHGLGVGRVRAYSKRKQLMSYIPLLKVGAVVATASLLALLPAQPSIAAPSTDPSAVLAKIHNTAPDITSSAPRAALSQL